MGLGAIAVEMTGDEKGGISALAITERVGFPRVRELVCISAGVCVESSPDGIITGDVRVKAPIVAVHFRGGGMGPGGQKWGRRTCHHTRRGNNRLRWGREGSGGCADSL